MESPPPPLPPLCYISQSSKKRVLPGSSSPSMEDDVVEIPPLTNRNSRLKSVKEIEVAFPKIIDADMDEEHEDIMLVDSEADTNGKGKEVFVKSLGSSTGTNTDSGEWVQTPEKNYASSSQYLINGDDFGALFFYGEKEYVDEFHGDHFYDDQYAIIQAHLDSLGIPPGVEVSIPWLTGQPENKMKPAVASTSNHSSLPIGTDNLASPPHSNSYSSIWPMESTSQGNSSLGSKLKAIGQPKKWEPSSSWLFEDPANVRKWPSESWHSKTKSNLPLADSMSGGGSVKRFSNHVSGFMKYPTSDTLTEQASHGLKKLNVQPGAVSHKHLGNSPLTGVASHIEKNLNDVQPGALSHNPVWLDMPEYTIGQSLIGAPFPSAFVYPSGPQSDILNDMAFGPYDVDLFQDQDTATSPGNSSGSFSSEGKYRDPSEFLKNFDLFKRFDTVQDSTDHYYSKNGSSVKQPLKNWAKKIQEEWRILENDLPDTIFVRIYESRMDILRAVILGAEGTPYHDGLFFFDVFFPSNYPNVPPHVYYHSGGLRINPNLYSNGKVCLSLLNTWAGSHEEMWIPGVSTILQVLVSIQGLILNAKPYFNEPGYANMSGTRGGERSSLKYNERTFILSLKTMVYNIRRPPKYFEDLVAGHFYKRAGDILVACKAYIDGAQVGCLVKGGVQDADEGDKSCYQHFKKTLAEFIGTLVSAFAEIGVKDCDEFLSLAQKTNRPVSAAPMTPDYYC